MERNIADVFYWFSYLISSYFSYLISSSVKASMKIKGSQCSVLGRTPTPSPRSSFHVHFIYFVRIMKAHPLLLLLLNAFTQQFLRT